MEINVTSDAITSVKTGAIILGYFEGTERLTGELADADKALDGAVSQLITLGEIKGKAKEMTLIHTLGKLPGPRLVIIGLGKQAELNLNTTRGALAEACRSLRHKCADSIATTALGAGVNGISPESAAQAIAEGAMLGLYSFRTHLTRKENNHTDVKQLLIVGNNADKPALERGLAKGRILAEAANLARNMVNEPANYMTPSLLAEAAVKLANEHGLEVTVFEREKMAELGMGALLGVAQGSRQPPKFIILTYKGKPSDEIDVALVGKGITFDTGGISLKPPEGMEKMKGDKAGGVAVIAAMGAIARLKPKINVTALIPATENMPGGNAMKPGDILTAITGETIEVISTDAEGRLILADALGYAVQHKARRIIDVATLTGACRIALGDLCTGAMGNNQELMNRIIAAGNDTGELMWQLPMYDDYREKLKSDSADIKNVGGPLGGAITAAKFLADFVGNTPWVHLDIAATSMSDKEKGHLVKGATGVPVRTLISLVLSLAES
ncbi:MAG: leucyl aminopeptidase [Dehalococcoidales bacterium]|nr:leucyl aminopeptidase [Dehalococcoidales bacterium]